MNAQLDDMMKIQQLTGSTSFNLPSSPTGLEQLRSKTRKCMLEAELSGLTQQKVIMEIAERDTSRIPR